ncbi:MAG: (5-formylfuran-3-yl)methyl phosphate synthase [Methanomicrobiales archaeon]|nr:(5-formylfuran-3-yl)methyl phosphate synthase [Methanomicrobiales archaeon]NYT21694.1 (5-formylfuran-3-yl)methyl phosphate synthase [Methanomicrobiales archaeon]
MRLLVSPRDIDEAKRSLAADIIDVKRPAEGSLGANFPWVIRAITELSHKPVSAAIGDFDFRPGGASLAAYGAAHAGADFVKVGLMFDGTTRAAEFIRAVVRAVKDEFPEKYVVIASYSDYERLGTISPFAMSPLAAAAGADVAMVDTGIKDGKSTFDFMTEESLREFTVMNRDAGMMTALAGSLGFDHLPALKRIDPDIIGVRGMVCGGNRDASIREDLVDQLVRMVG